MAGKFLSQSGPPEMVLHIMMSCESTQDVLALAASCRRTRSVWQGHAAAILHPLLLRELPNFDEALIAARMTSLVIAAERNGEIASMTMSPDDLSGSCRPPNTAELRDAFALCRLSRGIFVHILHSHLDLPEDRGESIPRNPEDPSRMPEFEARIRKAIHRSFIIGAALAGAYNEPLLKAAASGDPELTVLANPINVELTNNQLRFLEQFAVCNMAATPEAEEAVFGRLADWLLKNILADSEARAAMADRFDKGFGRAKYCMGLGGPDTTLGGGCPVRSLEGIESHSDAHLVVWEVMQILWVCNHMYESISRPESYHSYTVPRELPNDADQDPPRRAFVVFWGLFRSEEVTLPESISLDQEPSISAELATFQHDEEAIPYDPDYGGPTGRAATVFFRWIRARSGHPNTYGEFTGNHVPLLTLKVFQYFLRHYTGLRFQDETFGIEAHDDPLWTTFVDSLAIFSHDDVENRASVAQSPDVGAADFYDGSEILVDSDWELSYSPLMFNPESLDDFYGCINGLY